MQQVQVWQTKPFWVTLDAGTGRQSRRSTSPPYGEHQWTPLGWLVRFFSELQQQTPPEPWLLQGFTGLVTMSARQPADPPNVGHLGTWCGHPLEHGWAKGNTPPLQICLEVGCTDMESWEEKSPNSGNCFFKTESVVWKQSLMCHILLGFVFLGLKPIVIIQ